MLAVNLVKDISTIATTSGSNPNNIVEVGLITYFKATTDATGTELSVPVCIGFVRRELVRIGFDPTGHRFGVLLVGLGPDRGRSALALGSTCFDFPVAL
jgi:hypothetical protein